MLAKASSNKEKKMEEGQNKQIVITVKKAVFMWIHKGSFIW